MTTPSPSRHYVTTAIPYVNARPHIGFAMELVMADVIARYRRLRGDDVRALTGTDENALKNVQAAEQAGIDTATFVQAQAAAFEALREPLNLSFDDFIRTSAQRRHARGVTKLWQACAARGDIDKRAYRGLYCVGCEQFYAPADLVDGRCPEHDSEPELVEEDNYFFRLSRYEAQILALLESGRLRIVPEGYRNEILAFVRGGLADLSISRSRARARGWGIGVPDDPSQVMYVWFDALGNYVTALDYADEGDDYVRYWVDSDARVHVIGKGITRFHAVYWPAILLSAGLPLPTTLVVHGYLTVDGRKIGKSLGNAIDPEDIVARHGTDPVRYFLCRHVRFGRDGDFHEARLVTATHAELADQLGNLLRRTVSMIARYTDGGVPAPTDDGPFAALAVQIRDDYERAFADYRIDDAVRTAWTIVDAANRHAVERAPWKLAKRDDPAARAALRTTLYELAEALRLAAVYLAPFLPYTAAQIRHQLGLSPAPEPWDAATRWGGVPVGATVTVGEPLFAKTSPAA